jgi:hypothetical protein
MVSKNLCFMISFAPSGPAPNLLVGFLFNKLTIKFLASYEILLGSLRGPLMILWKSSSLFPEKYGGEPTNIS